MSVLPFVRRIALTLPWSAALTLPGATIPGLFSTGVNSNGTLLAQGTVDPHYKLIASADTSFPGPNCFVVNEGFPIPPWVASGPNSKWIAPLAAQGTGNNEGNYTYRTTFVLTNLDPTTVVITGQWSVDNTGTDILVNGQSSGVANNAGFGGFTAFTISAAGGAPFQLGTNTLDFVVNNAPSGINPTGFRAELGGTADALPPPGTPPTIIVPPASQSVLAGDGVTFTVTARGSLPLNYQWRFNGVNIPGATGASYTINAVSANDAGSYDVVITNDGGTVPSAAATLTIGVASFTPTQLTYEPPGPSSRRTGLAISEIMYHPAPRADGRNLEFVELYNSNPFPEDLSGYRLGGDLDYTFPANTVIAGLGYLVIAPAPADVQAVYGITGVLGGFTNSLPNGVGTVRLLKRSGAIVLEVNYSDQPPWPVAADGTGHSLVLARASYGENNPRAWAASAATGGSPGAPDPVPAEPVENVVINELLARSEPPLRDFIELYNHSALAVDLSGCWLSDDPNTNKFRIADGATLPAGGFMSFDETQLGFSLSAAGETIYFWNSNQTRVVDAVRFGGQARNVSLGRSPDGAEGFRALAARTPGAPNAPARIDDVVINEIMYAPISGLSDDEFVELYNHGAGAVEIGGWRFINGIKFTFPAGAVIPAGGYLVVAKNAARLQTNYPGLNSANLLGNFSGTLANGGELLTLARPDIIVQTNAITLAVTTNQVDIVVDEVAYGSGGRWGKWSAGGGSSLELIDWRADHRLAANWADSDDTTKSTWTWVTNTGVLDLGHPAQSAADQLQIFLEGAGEALVDDVEVFGTNGVNRISNPSFETGTTGWFFQGTQRATSWETGDGYNSTHSLHLRASERGDHVANRVRTPLTPTLPAGSVATIRARVKWLHGHPEILFRLKGGYLEAAGRLDVPVNLGTPGAANSRALANAGPAISEVSHRPVLPQANKSIRVSARVSDPDGLASVVLKYRLDPDLNFLAVPMVDDGTGGDAVANDGIFTGVIPGQAAGKLLAFHVEATDAFAVAAQFPDDAPARECLVRVGEVMPPGAYGTYRFWITQATYDFWRTREKMSNEALDATFVHGTNRVVYNAGALYSGSSYTAPIYDTPTGALCGYNLFFPPDDTVLGENHFTLDWPIRDDTDQREQLMFWFLEQFGLPNNYRRYVNLYVNGVKRGAIYDDVQQPGGGMINEWFPNDKDGSLYKTDCWNEFDDAANRIDPCVLNSLENFTSSGRKKAARYRWNWRPRAINGSANDFTDLFALVDAMNAPGAAYQAAVESVVDVEHWMRTFCMNDLASFWDAFGNPNAKNTYLYKPQNDRWKLFCWDFDVGLGVFNDPTDAVLFPSLGDPAMNRFYTNPVWLRAYWRSMTEALNGFFTTGPGTAIDAVLDAKFAAFQANGIALNNPAAIKSWISARRSFLQGQLNTVAANFTVSGTNSYSTNRNVATLAGTAPVTAASIVVNGVAWPVTWTSVTGWRMNVPLASGTNTLTVQLLDRFGNATTNAPRVITINYTGGDVSPQGLVVFNEIMPRPAVPGAEFVEIYNSSATAGFDLSGWRINGLGYTFPPRTLLTNGQFMILAKDRAVFAAVYGGVPVYDIFPGSLAAIDETLTLIQPGMAPAPDTVVDKVRYESVTPWPAAGGAASLQLIDAAQDNARVANWATSGADWQYAKFTGANASTRLLIFLGSAGDVYLDDIVIVPGTVPEVGTNIVINGDFEGPLTTNQGGPWVIPANMAATTISTSIVHSGQRSLHVAATSAGGGLSTSIAQDTLPIMVGSNYTLSFWFLPSTNGSNVTIRTTSASFRPQFNYRPAFATPGSVNSSAGVLPPFPLVWLNEVLPRNVTSRTDHLGEHDPWLELFNSDAVPLSLEGFFLADNFSNLTQWPFPSGASLAPGEFKILFLDGQPGQSTATEWHTSFALRPDGGDLALARLVGSSPQLVDYLHYPALGPDRSYGSFPDGQLFDRQEFFYVTPGASNNAHAAPLVVFINEWMAANTATLADPADGKFDDWFELYNPGDTTVDLAGHFLTDNLSNPFQFAIPAGYTIPPHGHLLVWADNDPGQNATNRADLHVNFQLAKGGEAIGLHAPDGTAIDTVIFGAQTNDVSQGRCPDGGATIVFQTTPTPRGVNTCTPPPPLRLTDVKLLAGGDLSLGFGTLNDHHYRVEFKNDLNDLAWATLGPDLTGTGDVLTVTDPVAGRPMRFYRLVSLDGN